MKSIVQPHVEQLKQVSIFLEDLDGIIALLREECREVEIQTGNHLLENLDEIANLHTELLHEFKITGREPDVVVDMRPDGLWLYIKEDTPRSRGLFEKIKIILVRCRRPFVNILSNPFISGFISPMPLFGAAYAIKDKNFNLLIVYLVAILFCIAWIFYGYQSRIKRYSIIVPKYRIDSPDFLKRNIESIVLIVISALIGALVTYLIK